YVLWKRKRMIFI
nr:Chain A, YW12 [synthetic construct]